MHRHIEHAYDPLWAEHQRIHRIHIRLLAQGDVERSLSGIALRTTNISTNSWISRNS
jgi:hypothetical protein